MDIGRMNNDTDAGIQSELQNVNNMGLFIAPKLCSTQNCPSYNGSVENITVWLGTEEAPIHARTMANNDLLDISKYLLLYCLPPILLLGSIGNILCMVVLQRKAMQTTPSSTYLICLAATDTLLLYASAAKTWMRLVTGYELLHSSDAMCRLQKYTFFTCTHLSAWLVVLLSIERFMVVTFPFRAPNLVLVRRPRLVSAILAVVVLAVNVNLLWATELKYTSKAGPQCVVYGEDLWMCRALPIFNLLVYTLLPSVIILITNVAIIALVLRRSLRCMLEARAHSMTTTTPTPDQSCYTTSSSNTTPVVTMATTALSNKTQRRLTCTLVIICVSWLVLSIPYSVMDNVQLLRSNILVRTLCYVCLYLNHALNFYIYCLTGKKFRLELRRAFGCKTHPRASLAGHKHHFHRPQQHQQKQEHQEQHLLKHKLTDTIHKAGHHETLARTKAMEAKDSPRAHLYN